MKTLLMSDLHVGFKYSRAQDILKVLNKEKFDRLILVGDIFDIQQMMKRPHWDENHTNVLKKILKIAKKKEVVYVIGNHDYPLFYLQEYTNKLASIHICREFQYESNGVKILCLHGDQLESIAKGWHVIGDWLYYFSLKLNTLVNYIRKIFKMPYWSFSKWCKDKAKSRIATWFNMEEKLEQALYDYDADKLVYGHTHMPYAERGGKFSNCGTFVEIATYLTEENGTFTLNDLDR